MQQQSYVEMRRNITGGSVSSVVENFLKVIEEKNPVLNAFVEVFAEESRQRAEVIDKKIQQGKAGRLAGMVVALKDNICYKGHKVSASSRILENFESLFSATVVERLLAEDAIIIGRTGCDEFAMGSSSERSYYGKIRNPWDITRTPGGSSGGSAAAVAAGMCHAALGSDTGGSIRQPASFCGIVGVKPTYGRVSRWGLIAYASSFDQIGPMTNNIEDAALLLEVIAGKDEYDDTSSSKPVPPYSAILDKPVKKIAWFPQYIEHKGVDETVKKAYLSLIEKLKQDGFSVYEEDFPYLDYLVPTYYVLTTAEASSNLARYDGVRYGYRSADAHSMQEMYVKSRSEGFGFEVKRRIMLGTFVLSAGYYDAYYAKAQKVRRMIKEATDKVLGKAEVVVLPTTPHGAFVLDSIKDPIAMYLEDIFTVQANLSGHPAMSIPLGKDIHSMPFGVQIIGRYFEEATMFAAAKQIARLVREE